MSGHGQPASSLALLIGGATDPGRKREKNEDTMYASTKLGLAIVADGMGGHRAGEIASRLAADTVKETIKPALRKLDREWITLDSARPLQRLMEKAILRCNEVVRDAGTGEYEGMGTTVVAMLVRDNWFAVGNVGDSRCYRYRDGQLTQLSTDHSWVQGMVDSNRMTPDEARTSPRRGLLVQAIGNPEVTPSVFTGCPSPGDCFLLCSDGLTEVVDDIRIGEVLGSQDEPQEAAMQLIALANQNGGPDNITAIVIHIDSGS